MVLADESASAVGVPRALRSASSDRVRFGDESGLTPADGVAEVVGAASGALAARVRLARIRLANATVGLADVAHAAVAVPGALRSASGDGVGVGHVVLDASALGVAVAVHRAGGARPTRRRTAGIAAATLAHIPGPKSILEQDGRSRVLLRAATTVNGVGSGNVAALAFADGVTLIIGSAFAVLPAGIRMTRSPGVLETSAVP